MQRQKTTHIGDDGIIRYQLLLVAVERSDRSPRMICLMTRCEKEQSISFLRLTTEKTAKYRKHDIASVKVVAAGTIFGLFSTFAI